MSNDLQQHSMIVRIERALVLLACFIQRDGDIHVPLFEKFEAELSELKAREGTKDRARRLLESYSRFGEVKAIAAKNFNLSTSEGPLP
jgi:hypothetical protein